MDGYMERLEQAKGIAEELLNSKRYDFDGLKPSDLQDKLSVVYAIFDKTDDICLYVGRTKNLRRRLYTNHLMGPEANARLKKYLVKDTIRTDILIEAFRLPPFSFLPSYCTSVSRSSINPPTATEARCCISPAADVK